MKPSVFVENRQGGTSWEIKRLSQQVSLKPVFPKQFSVLLLHPPPVCFTLEVTSVCSPHLPCFLHLYFQRQVKTVLGCANGQLQGIILPIFLKVFGS